MNTTTPTLPDLCVVRVGEHAFLWRPPRPPEPGHRTAKFRVLRIRWHDARTEVDGPNFGGHDDDPDDDSGSEGRIRPPTPTERKILMLHEIQTLGMMYLSPYSTLDARRVAVVLGRRESTVAKATPACATSCGRRRVAPFHAWLAALDMPPPWGDAKDDVFPFGTKTRDIDFMEPDARPRRKVTPRKK